ncbi:hypothetical protein CEXT_661851 [Caerostris extrusa]|uniref:Uncharacterized protein n=1 Tax=Caerostris extrusa TaxID=172846 RepID=A0AAV4UPA5_CAEEX|nr:hypothetical protein CEXT_661851 [Caerostris extrusa]
MEIRLLNNLPNQLWKRTGHLFLETQKMVPNSDQVTHSSARFVAKKDGKKRGMFLSDVERAKREQEKALSILTLARTSRSSIPVVWGRHSATADHLNLRDTCLETFQKRSATFT